MEDPARTLRPLDREVGARDVADKQAVSGEHGPGLATAAQVGQQEAGVFGPVSGRVQGLDPQGAERELGPVVKGLVLELRRDQTMDMDGGAGGGREAAMSGDVIGVVVGLEDVSDADAEVARELQVLVDLETRIHDRRDALVLVADEVGRAPQIVMYQLSEDHLHGPPAAQRAMRTPRVSAVETWTAA